ncbi:MAG: hypothetical protein CMM46_11000 [Rhodospirillaceae bacterium]|nr:hypothetical protein [Rhodospirillaceae bacterium]|tara:strand:+ start:68 stop:460 length:393 start_codon:yes stop_codon:yes gene_type:complete
MAIGALARLLVVGGDVILITMLLGREEAGLYHAAIVLALVNLIPHVRFWQAHRPCHLARFRQYAVHAWPDQVGVAGAGGGSNLNLALSALGILTYGLIGAALAYLINRIGIAVVLFVMTRRETAYLACHP